MGQVNSKRKQENKGTSENWRNRKPDQERGTWQKRETKAPENWRNQDRPKNNNTHNVRTMQITEEEGGEKEQEESPTQESEN